MNILTPAIHSIVSGQHSRDRILNYHNSDLIAAQFCQNIIPDCIIRNKFKYRKFDMRILKGCLGIAIASIVSTSFSFGQENTTTQNGIPLLSDKLKQWSEEEFLFKGTISKHSSTQAPFRIYMDDRTKYNVLFDAGYKARKKIEACLDATFDCKISGISLMIFERNATIMNIIEVSEVIQSEIDFTRINSYLRNCMQRSGNDFKNHPVQAQLGLEITKIRPIKYQISNLESPPSEQALEIIKKTLDTCFKRRVRLPVGHYKLSFASQSRNFILENLQKSSKP